MCEALHCHSLTAQADAVASLLSPFRALSAPLPLSFHGPHVLKTQRLQVELLRVLQHAVATLSELCPTIRDQALVARSVGEHSQDVYYKERSLRDLTEQLSEALAEQTSAFSSLASTASSIAHETGIAERFFAAERTRKGLEVVDGEHAVAAARLALSAAEKRVSELNDIVDHARKNERRAKEKLLLAQLTAVFRLGRGALSVRDAASAVQDAQGVVDVAIRDRLRAQCSRTGPVRAFLLTAASARRKQEDLVRSEEYTACAVDRYAALICLEKGLKDVERTWTWTTGVCQRLFPLTTSPEMDLDGLSEELHTIWVVLRWLRVALCDVTRLMLGCLDS